MKRFDDEKNAQSIEASGATVSNVDPLSGMEAIIIVFEARPCLLRTMLRVVTHSAKLTWRSKLASLAHGEYRGEF